MVKRYYGRKIILTVTAVVIGCSAVIMVHAAGVKKRSGSPVDYEKEMYGRRYFLKKTTTGGAGIYSNPENDRTMDYVIDAIEEAGIDKTMTDFDKIAAVNDYLCDKLDYVDYTTEEGNSYKENWILFTDYCLLSDTAVCAGYAEAFQSMCCSLGIECWYVTGYVTQDGEEKTYHAWNLVTLDGKDYYIDTIWNDGFDNAYYLTENIWDDHEIDAIYETYKISGQTFPMPSDVTGDK